MLEQRGSIVACFVDLLEGVFDYIAGACGGEDAYDVEVGLNSMQVGEYRVCFVESLFDGERDLVLESLLDWLLSLGARRHCLVFRH